MSECNWALLPDRGVLRVWGDDAQKYLQGLVTNDVTKIGGSGAIYAAILTPQGKILFDFFIIADIDGFLLEAPRDRLSALQKRLIFYKLRADVHIEALSDDTLVAAQWGTPCPELSDGIWFPDPRLSELCSRLILNADTAARALSNCQQAAAQDYDAFRINLGIPEGGRDFAYEDAFPHDVNFDLIAGVDFQKGCFVGQEVVSRKEHRGTARKRVVCVEALEGQLESGAEITAREQRLGTIGSVAGARGLGLVRIDRATQAITANDEITAGDCTVSLFSPPYASFGLRG